LEKELALNANDEVLRAFWDVDAPATLARVEKNPADPFRRLIPEYDLVFTYGGGAPVVKHYLQLGAKSCHPIYNGLDPETHHPVPPDPQLACDLVLVANRLPDRERRIEDFFIAAAKLAPERRFILGGEGWGDKALPANVRWIGHVVTDDHNRVNCSARIILNLNRDSMAHVGFSPPTRVFEAAGTASCVITDAWTGIDMFFTPGKEILVAFSAEQIVQLMRNTSPREARQMGTAMRARALNSHTYAQRAAEVQEILASMRSRTGVTV